MDFLRLCQAVARESGTVSGTQPLTVTNQTGRLGKIVSWTDTAWLQIQNSRNAWLWMEDEFEAPVSATVNPARYTATSFSLPRWGAWILREDAVTIYRQSAGVADERPLLWIPWNHYKRMYERGEQHPNYPQHYSISPHGEFCIGPRPDDDYVIQGPYRKSPQRLSENNDVPEMPEQYHELIVWDGCVLLAEHDEGRMPIAANLRRRTELRGNLERDQLPRITIGGSAFTE